jgi:hypothetical protein
MISKELEEAFAALDALVAEPPKVKLGPKAPEPRMRETVVEVGVKDPNWSAANGGRVRVGITEHMYWNAVDRAFNPPIFAEVISGYNPFSKERLPGFDPGEDRR